MRISGGTLRGRTVKIPPGTIRPSMDRMRESVFAALGDLAGASFLDMFSGTGIIALEAASRGALYIDAVEKDPRKRDTLIGNVSISPVRIHCHCMAAELYIKRAKRNFDYIFCDPPFPYRFKWELIRDIAASALVREGTLILLQRPREDFFDGDLNFIRKLSPREFGRSVVEFLQIQGDGETGMGES